MSFGLVVAIFAYMGIAFFISYVVAEFMIRRTEGEVFLTNVFTSAMVNLLMLVLAIFGWFVYFMDVTAPLFVSGVSLAAMLFIVSEGSLAYLLYKRRTAIEEGPSTYEIAREHVLTITTAMKRKIVTLKNS